MKKENIFRDIFIGIFYKIIIVTYGTYSFTIGHFMTQARNALERYQIGVVVVVSRTRKFNMYV